MTFLNSHCDHEDCVGTVPELEFNQLVMTDSTQGVLTMNFFDCDGDVGLSDRDTVPPYNADSRYHYNYYLDYYEKRDGEWFLVDFGEGGYKYRIPVITPEGRFPELEGEIDVDLFFFPTEYDTFKFSVTLIDRALNESEPVETPEFVNSL